MLREGWHSSAVTTPHIKESAKENSVRKLEDDGEVRAMCKFCRHAFAIKRAEEAPFTDGKVIPLPVVRVCDAEGCPGSSFKLLRPGVRSRKEERS